MYIVLGIMHGDGQEIRFTINDKRLLSLRENEVTAAIYTSSIEIYYISQDCRGFASQ